MEPANIVSIALAAISALTSLGAVMYAKSSAALRDRQDTTIKITNKITGDGGPAQSHSAENEIVITFQNDETAITAQEKMQNGMSGAGGATIQTSSTNPAATLLHAATSSNAPALDASTQPLSPLSDFDHALEANNNGDRIIGETRTHAVMDALTVFNQIVELTVKAIKPAASRETAPLLQVTVADAAGGEKTSALVANDDQAVVNFINYGAVTPVNTPAPAPVASRCTSSSAIPVAQSALASSSSSGFPLDVAACSINELQPVSVELAGGQHDTAVAQQ